MSLYAEMVWLPQRDFIIGHALGNSLFKEIPYQSSLFILSATKGYPSLWHVLMIQIHDFPNFGSANCFPLDKSLRYLFEIKATISYATVRLSAWLNVAGHSFLVLESFIPNRAGVAITIICQPFSFSGLDRRALCQWYLWPCLSKDPRKLVS